MTRGDWLCAPLRSHLVWNHAIREGMEGNELSWVRERDEFDRAMVNSGDARVAYADAERLFRTGRAQRGLAALELRRAYLAVLGNDYDAAHPRELYAAVGEVHLPREDLRIFEIVWCDLERLAQVASAAHQQTPALERLVEPFVRI